MSDFNLMSWRPIKNGTEFNSLFPKSTCTKTVLGYGDTDFSIKEMNVVVSEFAQQTEQIANVLKKSNLQDTCNAIKDFVYNHFQYKADGDDQMLRSPACSWYDRATGIDCKSYTILVSCILTNLNIKSYIRRIKQAGYAPEQFTHVYVVVPIDQETGSLESGSICIDGTINQKNEPSYLFKNDLYMDLKHYSLNGLYSNEKSLNGAFRDFIHDKFSKFDFSSLSSYTHIFGCGDWNSAYDTTALSKNLKFIETYFNDLINSINQNASTGKYVEFSHNVAEFLAAPIVIENGLRRKKDEGWNGCTEGNLDKTIDMVRSFKGNTALALKAYTDNFFNAGSTTSIVFSNNQEDLKQHQIDWMQGASVTQPLIQYTAKQNIALKAFEITPYVISKMGSPNQINPTEFLASLTQLFSNGNGNGNNSGGIGNNGTGNNSGNGTNDFPNTPPASAGFGVIGWLFIGGALIYGVNIFSKTTKITK